MHKTRDQPAFWREYFSNCEATIFPKLIAGDPESNDTQRRCTERFNLPNQNGAANIINAHGINHMELIAAAWALLLTRYFGSNQVCFGIGLKQSNETLFSACRVEFSDDITILSAIKSVKAELEVPLALAVGTAAEFESYLEVNRGFNTAIHFDFSPNGALKTEQPLRSIGTAITLCVDQESAGISLHLEHSTTQVSSEAASLIAATLRTILANIVTDSPSTLVKRMGTLSDEDLALTWSWNEKLPQAVKACMHDYFRLHAQTRPQALAIAASDAELTYAELDLLSNTLAHFLQSQGVGPDVVVPLCFEKSAWATVAMLACTKAGGAFTFLDSEYPMSRLQDIIGQVDAKFVLSSKKNLSLWTGHVDAFEVSATAIEALPPQISPPETNVQPHNILYIIFTSGSTGKPKGCVIEHSAYLTCALDQSKVCNMTQTSRVLQYASYSFDVSILENYTTLVVGGTICIPDESAREKGVASIINSFGITWALLTPSLVKLVKPSEVPNLKTLVLGGEALSQVDIVTWAGSIQLVNGYGPSECSIASAVNARLTPASSAANIGWPVGGLLWVVNPNDPNEIVPTGAIGELAIEGHHLARGYLNNPSKTAEAFIDNPLWMADFPPDRRRRIYLTGDLVRRNPDGSVEFIGRRDAQVKVRGLRIELGDIEHHLSIDPAVRLVTVLAPKSGACQKRLVAIVTLEVARHLVNDGSLKPIDWNPHDLRDIVRGVQGNLATRVQEYMVPSTWIVVQSFPLNASGKIDRVKVKKWVEGMDLDMLADCQCQLDDDEIEIPTNKPTIDIGDVETRIKEAIAFALNQPIERVTPNRSFVSLGGDSISAMQLVSRCKLANIGLKVKDILRCKSILELALCATELRKSVISHTETFDQPFGLSPIQKFFFELQPEGTRRGGVDRFNQSFLLRCTKHVPSEMVSAALSEIVQRHSMLRARFVETSEGWKQFTPRNSTGSFIFRECTADNDHELQRTLDKSHADIDMLNGPVFVVDLIMKNDVQLLSLVAHHAFIDLVSWRVIMKELEEFILDGQKFQAEKPLPFQVWCALQEKYSQEALTPEVAFPFDVAPSNIQYWGMEGKKNQFRDMTKLVFGLDSDTTAMITGAKCHSALRTEPVDLFLSALIHSFGEVFSDREIPTIFRESHGREPWDDSIDITSTVGWFTSMYPVHVPRTDDLVETIRRTKDAQRRVPNNGWPYFASRYNNPMGIEAFGSKSLVEIQFDYLGLYQQLERKDALFLNEPWPIADVGPEFNKFALFEITAEILNGKFQLTFEFNRTMLHQERIAQWVSACKTSLVDSVERLCALETTPKFTLSDFPLLSADYVSLDKLASETFPKIGIAADDVEDIYPTSPMQTGLILSQAKSPGLYQFFSVFEVEPLSAFESVEPDRLERAWQSVIERHTSLRTIFIPGVGSESSFGQVVLKRSRARVVKMRCANDDISTLYDPIDIPLLDTTPPHQLTICEADSGKVYIRIDINHSLVDGSSSYALINDLSIAYDDKPATTKVPPYSDYVAYLQTCDIKSGFEYWTNYLQGVEPCSFPTLDDGVVQDGTLCTTKIEHSLQVSTLNRICQSLDITLPTIFKFAWALTLQAYSGSQDVCFGYLVAGRDAPVEGISDCIGAFINMLICRVDTSGTVASILRKLQDDSVSALQHQYCSLAEIQHEVGASQPLFNSAVNFQVVPPETTVDSSISVKFLHHHDPSEYHIAVDIAVSGDELNVEMMHKSTSLSRGMARNVASTLGKALQAILSIPAETVASTIDLYSEYHHTQVWKQNHLVQPRIEMCIHDAIARQVKNHPHSLAIHAADGQWSYDDLDKQSTRLGKHLSHIGIGRGTIVPLCFEKSGWTTVAMLGVLKAGAGFVLLDPAHGQARISTIVNDVKADFAVTSRLHRDLLLEEVGSVLVVDSRFMDGLEVVGCCTRVKTLPPVEPSDVAYIIFTSGSTGKPKGSVTQHSSFVTSAAAHGKRGQLSVGVRVFQYASYSFDACLLETLTGLMFGACICVPNEKSRLDDVAGAINEFNIDWATITPSVARLIDPAKVPGLKFLGLAGEAMSKTDINRWKGHVKLMNAYGPSECSVASTWNPNVKEDPVNLGLAVGGCTWIVDPQNHERLVPFGAVGELVIEGFTLAMGYLNNKTKTDEVFVPIPGWLQRLRGGKGPNRIYKTGDLVRYNSDTTLSFIGRRDTQVKLNGQRIEFGEIEYALQDCPVVVDVAVDVVRPQQQLGRPTIAAFFTMLGSIPVPENPLLVPLPEAKATELRQFQDSLSAKLPPYMIPKLFIPVRSLPRNATGKLDRRQLVNEANSLSLELLRSYALSVSSGQRTLSSVEKKLQTAWAKALLISTASIGASDDFFRLGGDSISAMRLVSVAREEFDLAITVADVFNNPRLENLAATAKDQSSSPHVQSLEVAPFALFEDDDVVHGIIEEVAAQCSVPVDCVEDIYPCTPLQEGLMALSMKKEGSYLGQMVFRIPSNLDLARLKDAWEEVVRVNPILRTRLVTLETTGTLQAVLRDSIEWRSGQSLEQYLDDDIKTSITWGSSLARYAIIGTPGMSYLAWSAHHTLYDGWSQGLIFEQVKCFYNGTSVPALVPFNSFINYTINLDGTTCAEFWESQFSGESPSPFPRLPSNMYTPQPDAVLERDISIAQSTRGDFRLSTFLRASWALLMSRYSDSEDIVFGAVMSGRNAPLDSVERVNGPTITTIPVRIQLDREKSISETLEMIQNQATDTIPFEHWGLQNILQNNKNAYFQNLLVIQPGQDDDDFLGLEAVPIDEASFHTYPLCLECVMTRDHVKAKLIYDPNIITTPKRLLCHFENILQQIIKHASDDTPVKSIEFCSMEDLVQIMEWNSVYPPAVHDTIHGLIARRCTYSPHDEAVCAWDGGFTYGELERLSTDLAKHLAGNGVKRGDIVPVVFEKSAWTVVAQLAVFKAGAALCMLDPAHPQKRLEDITETIRSKVVLASATHSSLAQSLTQNTIIVSGEIIRQLKPQQIRLPPEDADAAAYVVFTSGTTGKPKGSVTAHKAFASSSASLAKAMNITHNSRVLQYSAYSFDPYVLETFTTLIQGGCVAILNDEARTNTSELVLSIASMGVNWALLTPSVARLLPKSGVPTLKTLVLGGEAMGHGDKEWSLTVDLMNAYGPSECSVASVLNPAITAASDHATIGKGVGSLCWIVEPHNHHLLAPIGCVGELILESPGLSQGYIDEPKKTAEAFITAPSWLVRHRPDARLYKTGDLVRYDPLNGQLKYVARKDTQVKLHGQRLELGEIEHHLASHANVGNVAVTLPKNGPMKGKLVATLTLQNLASVETGDVDLQLIDPPARSAASRQLSEVSSYLENQVPAYMVPSAWAVVNSLPLTTSLKVNKRKIVAWLESMNEKTFLEVMELASAGTERTVSSTDMEKSLQEILARVLNLPADRIALNRSFLALGGDSITAMQVVTRCRASNISVKIKDILQSKTITHLAQSAEFTSKPAKIATKEDTTKPFDLTPIQRLYFETGLGKGSAQIQHNAESTQFNQSLLLTVNKQVTATQLKAAFNAIIYQHSMLRAQFSMIDGQWKQLTRSDPDGSYYFNHHMIRSIEDVMPVVALSQARIDPINGFVFSVDSFQLANNGHLLFIAAHHLVIDLVSWRIILQDLEEFFDSGKVLSQNSLQFQTWGRLQSEYATSHLKTSLVLPYDIPEAQYGYWGMDGMPNLFGDAVTIDFTLDAAVTSALLGPCNDAFGTEPMDIFLACLFQSFAYVFTDRAMPAIFCEGHGREPWDSDVDISETVGWFTTIYPIFMSLGSGTLPDAVRRVKDARRKIPSNGWEYFACRFLTGDGQEKFGNHYPMEMMFNYLGIYQQLEREGALLEKIPLPSTNQGFTSPTSDVGANCQRMALFDISAEINKGQASFSFVYNRHMRRVEDVRRWLSVFETVLKDSASNLYVMEPEKTLSDFPLLDLTYERLDKFQSESLQKLGLTNFGGIEDIYRCSPMQQGILISQIRDPKTYTNMFIFRVNSTKSHQTLDLLRIQTAWQKVVARHASLRTVFVNSLAEGLYDQVVLKTWFPSMLHFDCMEEEAVDQLSALPPLSYLENEPAHRLVICRTDVQWYIKLEISHALLDGASLGILLRDFNQAYEGSLSLSDVKPPLIRDYIAYIQETSETESMDYWKEQLGDMEPCNIPASPGALPSSKDVETFILSLQLSGEEIVNFCRAKGTTPANLFQLGWALVLEAYTGLRNVCFGYLTSGRDTPVENIDNIVGALCNMLVFKVALDPEKPMSQMLQEAQDRWINGLRHQFTPVASIKHELGFASESLFNTGISFRSDQSQASVPDWTLSFDLVDGYDPTEFDVTLNISQMVEKFEIAFNYRPVHINEGLARNLASTLDKAIKTIIKDPSTTMQSWNLVEESDVSLRGMPSIQPTLFQSTVDQTIERSVREAPHSQAVCAWDGSLSYSELDQLSNRLASYLEMCGVGPEVLVPVCMEKSKWVPVAILAVLKAGGAFVPMDATQPARFHTIVQQTGARFVLTSANLSPQFSQIVQWPIAIDEQFLHTLTSNSHPRRRHQPSSAAYILFTSGSTGNPKGCVIEHRAWCVSAAGQKEAWGISPETRMLQFASFSFDAAMGELLTPLMVGGCVCLPSESDRLNDIQNSIAQMKCNTTIFTPSFIKILHPDNMPSVHTMILGGESTPREEIKKWGGRVKLIPAYGPTEASLVSSSVTNLTLDTDPRNIGFTNTAKYWIVNPDNHNKLVPMGAIGELIIEGPILARGYLNNAKQTASAFVTNPAWALVAPGQSRRMYKTGDLAKVNSDGSYSYFGRKDTQVKLRGQRIELGEVEYHLKKAIGQEIPVAVEMLKFGGDARLVAFVEMGDEYEGEEALDRIRPSNKAKLQQLLVGVDSRMKELVPSYMVPSMYIPLKHIPLSASCKTDRKKLRNMENEISANEFSSLLTSSTTQTTAVSEAESQMRNIWAGVLRMPPNSINISDSFFSNGGDSILAIKLVSACREQGFEIAVADILRGMTLKEMCTSMKTTLPTSYKVAEPFSSLGSLSNTDFIDKVICPQVSTDKSNIADVLEATTMQSAFMTTGLLKSRGNTNYFVFHLSGPVNLSRLEGACKALVSAHPILRTCFVACRRRVFQVILHQTSPDFIHHQCAKWRFSFLAAKLVKADQAEPVVLGKQPVRFFYLDSGRQGVLIMRINHAQYDGVSVPVLVDDLAALYEGQGIPERPTFSEFAYLTKMLNTGDAEQYWYNLLKGSQMTNVVSHKAPPYKNTKLKIISRTIEHPPKVQGMTFATILKAAWGLVLAQFSSSNDVVFGHLIAGRNLSLGQGDVNEILGPCLNLIPVRVQLGPEANIKTAGDVLHQVYDQQLAGIPYETMGFERIVERCTEWPLWTRLSTLVQHQNLDGVEDMLKKFRFGDSTCKFGAFPGPQDTCDILVLSTPRDNNTTIELNMHFSEKVLETPFVTTMMDKLIESITLLTSADGTTRIRSTHNPLTPALIPTLSLEDRSPDGTLLRRTTKTAAALAAGISFHNTNARQLVEQAWHNILTPLPDHPETPEIITPTTEFYNIWGNLIAASQFSTYYKSHFGITISMEEILENPTMLSQSLLLEEKMNATIHTSQTTDFPKKGRRETKRTSFYSTAELGPLTIDLGAPLPSAQDLRRDGNRGEKERRGSKLLSWAMPSRQKSLRFTPRKSFVSAMG